LFYIRKVAVDITLASAARDRTIRIHRLVRFIRIAYPSSKNFLLQMGEESFISYGFLRTEETIYEL
jgi:hypothetical protein